MSVVGSHSRLKQNDKLGGQYLHPFPVHQYFFVISECQAPEARLAAPLIFTSLTAALLVQGEGGALGSGGQVKENALVLDRQWNWGWGVKFRNEITNL